MIPFLILVPLLIPAIGLDVGTLFFLMNYFFIVMAVAAVASLILLANFIVTVRRGDLPWHDRWAHTEVLRGR
jgi:hypothetical protein